MIYLVKTCQLQFIISDGKITNDKPKVEALVRRAGEDGVMLVFLIIDNTKEKKQSILDIKSVAYPKGVLTMTSYIETFPFPFYAVVRDTHDLPGILSGAVRQWFELQ